MIRRLRFPAALLPLLLALVLPAAGLAEEAGETTAPSTPTTSAPAPSAPAGEAAPTSTTAPEAAPAQGGEPAPVQVQSQHAQSATPSGSARSHTHAPGTSGSSSQPAGGSEAPAAAAAPAGHRALAPSALTPSLPAALQSSFGGVPSFFIESFEVPPFLLPIFQAAGTAYSVPWQVLAAINEVETDYGRDLSTSSAGAEGWMQFLPSEWGQYGVDANGDGFRDPYNPADAIFAAARYLHAAGAGRSIRAAVFSYNHSQAYVETVMLRAQLLGATPSELLGAITGLTEARFPVHAAAHFSDGFPAPPAGSAGATKPIVGTAIYSQAGAPVIAVQDGEIVQIGHSQQLGRFISLRDAFGNTYTYAQLGDISAVYPLIQPHVNSTVSARIGSAGAGEGAPSGPATAGAQPRSPLSEGATVSGLALGAAATLESAPAPASTPASATASPSSSSASSTPGAEPGVRVFREGANDVYLRPLRPGVHVIAGTVLGHIGAAAGASSGEAAPHLLFQIRPAGVGAPLIDPKPILDGWVALENTSIFRAKGENPFLATSPTIGQVLLESKQQLQPQVLHDRGIHLAGCARQDVQGGRVDKRVLAMLEYLSVSGLKPSISGLRCVGVAGGLLGAGAQAGPSEESVAITAVNGVPVAGHQGQGSISDTTVRRLLMLQGLARPRRIVSLMSYPGDAGAVSSRGAAAAIRVSYATGTGQARAAGVSVSGLSPAEWIKLIARLGEIPDPTVARGPSSAAIPDGTAAGATSGEGGPGGNG